jgi:hypothetical protein
MGFYKTKAPTSGRRSIWEVLRDLGTLVVTEKQLGEFWGNTTSYIGDIAILYGIRALPNRMIPFANLSK